MGLSTPAFVNALSEGPTKDIIDQIHEQRKTMGLNELPPNFYDHWDRDDLLHHLTYLWETRYSRPALPKVH